MNNVEKLLRNARWRIADVVHWTTGYFARDNEGVPVASWRPEATCWCLLGAMNWAYDCGHAGISFVERDQALNLLASVCPEGMADVNDDLGHAAVLDRLDRAILKATKEPGVWNGKS